MSTHPLKEPDDEREPGPAAQHHFDGGGGGGYDDPMHRRVNRLEQFANEARQRFDRVEARLERVDDRLERVEDRLERVEGRLERIEGRLERVEARLEFTATKEDLEKSASSTVKWIVGVLFALSMAAITIITFVLNYATLPKPAAPAAPAPAAQPIVIYVPSPPLNEPGTSAGARR